MGKKRRWSNGELKKVRFKFRKKDCPKHRYEDHGSGRGYDPREFYCSRCGKMQPDTRIST